MSENLIPIAVITSAHGLKGDVVIKSFSGEAESLTNYDCLWNEDLSEKFQITVKHPQKQRFVCALKGVKNRSQAENLKGTELFAKTEQLVDTSDHDEFYLKDLIGLDVIDPETREKIGQIIDVHNFGAGDVIEIEFSYPEHPPEMFTFDKINFPNIDLFNNSITFQRPDMMGEK